MFRISLLIVLFVNCVWCNEVGDYCQLKNNGKSGVCTPVRECKEAVDGLKAYPRITPTVCSYGQNNLIVCCPLSKRVEKCKEYAEYMFETITIESFRPGSQPLKIKKNRCGRDGSPFIIGGVAALSHEFPHSALLGYRANNEISWECGGSLVSSRYVLTAAHCLKSPDNGPVIKVRLGELDFRSTVDDAKPEDFDIETTIKYPEYKMSSKYHDIALLKLATQAKLSPYIRPICLPTKDVEPDDYIATGWGFTTNYGQRSTGLLKVKLQSFPYEECRSSFDYFISRKLRNGLQPTQICAGHRTEKRDTCNGDSGGPLEIYHNSIDCSSIQLGITSFGVDCATVNFPAVYTRVFKYVDWIEGIIWAPGEDL